MMNSVALRTGGRIANLPLVRACSTQSPWGTDHWRHEKKAFVAWCNDAVQGTGNAKREFYGFCALAFGDVDVDKDGFINVEQFDRLLEKVAAIPRRYGLAPLSTENATERLQRHKAIFDKLDTKNGPARGVLGLDQCMEWTFEHVAGKITEIPEGDVALYHPEDYNEAEYLAFIERALVPGSYEHSSFYNFILNCFVEADTECQGRVNYEQFSKLLCRAAVVPRQFGLAPDTIDDATRRAMFTQMELKRDGIGQGFVTARKFWEWTVEHTQMKIDLQKAGKGWRENH
jgi:hypothetical protein